MEFSSSRNTVGNRKESDRQKPTPLFLFFGPPIIPAFPFFVQPTCPMCLLNVLAQCASPNKKRSALSPRSVCPTNFVEPPLSLPLYSTRTLEMFKGKILKDHSKIKSISWKTRIWDKIEESNVKNSNFHSKTVGRAAFEAKAHYGRSPPPRGLFPLLSALINVRTYGSMCAEVDGGIRKPDRLLVISRKKKRGEVDNPLLLSLCVTSPGVIYVVEGDSVAERKLTFLCRGAIQLYPQSEF